MLASIRRAGAVAIAAALLAPFVAAKGALGLKAGKASIISPDGASDVSYPVKGGTSGSAWTSPLRIPDQGSFKLAFTVVDVETSDPVVPQQAHLVFASDSGDDVTLAISVKDNGKASYTLNPAKAPASLLASLDGVYHLSLLVSNVVEQTPIYVTLGDIVLPSTYLSAPKRNRHDLPARAGEPTFVPQGELFHTFRPEEKEIPFFKSAVGVAIVLAPWVVLVGLIAKISPSLLFRAPPTTSYLFLACLIGLQGLILRYWAGWRLYELLPPFLALSAITAYVGTVALRALRVQRLKAGGAP